MIRSFSISLLLVMLFSSNAVAGFGSKYSSPFSSDSVVAPIQIKDKGIYNLVVSIQFLNEPYEKRFMNPTNTKIL